jgi:2-succinyl-6-hydroxy-2,4-cyclohexadiene-1-carboxylate synthase
VALHAEVRGTGPPLVLLHGFTQTGRLWGPFGERLAESRTLIAVDLPGHAGSDSVRADLPETAKLVADAVRAALASHGGPDGGVDTYDMLGYSLGARLALHVVTGTDLEVARLVVIGATGGIPDPAERDRRRSADEAIADQLEASGDVESFVDAWLGGPMFARLSSSDHAGRGERLRNSASGLASSLRLCGTGTQLPLWERLRTLSCPVLALAGADDTRFAALALRLARTVPLGVATLVPGGGHAVHLAQPEQCWRIVDHWLAPGAPELTPERPAS